MLYLFVFFQKTDQTSCRTEKVKVCKQSRFPFSWTRSKIFYTDFWKKKKKSLAAFKTSSPEELFGKVFSLLFYILVYKEDTIKSAA